MSNPNEHATKLLGLLGDPEVQRATHAIRDTGGDDLSQSLELARSLCQAAGDTAREHILRAELVGFKEVGLEIPDRRRVAGHASPFPVRAIGLLEPEEIFLANREKFAQVTLTIGQSVRELEDALEQIQEGGVLALRVPASEVSGEAVTTDSDSEVYIYVLPREIEAVVDGAKDLILEAFRRRLVESVVGPYADLPPEYADAISMVDDTVDTDDDVETTVT